MAPRLRRSGWRPPTGVNSIPWRLGTIYRTNRRAAHAAGQWARILRTAKALPYLLYSLGPNRDHHVAIAGTILPFDAPFWHTRFPPNGWGCKCRVRQISSRERERLLTDEATRSWPCPTIGSASRR